MDSWPRHGDPTLGWDRMGGHAESFEIHGNEDWDFWIGALDLGVKVAHVARPLYFYHRHPALMTAHSMPPVEWKMREIIVNRRPGYFAVGDRKKIFLTDGLLRSAKANRQIATDGFRWCLLGGQSQLYLPGLVISLVVVSTFLWIGVSAFRRQERTFADVI